MGYESEINDKFRYRNVRSRKKDVPQHVFLNDIPLFPADDTAGHRKQDDHGCRNSKVKKHNNIPFYRPI